MAGNNPEPLPAPRDEESTKPVASENVAPGQLAGREDAWRYRYHLGRWWYFVEPKHWLYWDGNCWQDRDRKPRRSCPTAAYSALDWHVARWPRGLSAFLPRASRLDRRLLFQRGGYGSSDFGYGYGIPSYGPGTAYVNGEVSGPTFTK